MASQCLEKGTNLYPTNVVFWTERLRINIGLNKEKEEVDRLYHEAILKFDPVESLSIRTTYLLFRLLKKTDFSENLKLFRETIALPADATKMNKFKNEILHFLISHTYSSDEVRQIYTCALQFPSKDSLPFYQKIIQLEVTREIPNSEFIRTLFENTVTTFGTKDYSIWLLYIFWERDQKRMKESSILYWRATKALKSPDLEDFIQIYNQQNNQVVLNPTNLGKSGSQGLSELKDNPQESSEDDDISDDDDDDDDDDDGSEDGDTDDDSDDGDNNDSDDDDSDGDTDDHSDNDENNSK